MPYIPVRADNKKVKVKLDITSDEKRFSVAVRDPVWQHIWLTKELRDITLSEPFLRLYRIKQLGPTEFVYPGATHTRASHSLGVYHIALKMLRVLLARGANAWVTEKGSASFLVAALLHDLGHFPFTHSLKELPLLDHETLTSNMLRKEPLKGLIEAAGADISMVEEIVDKQRDCSTPNESETRFFRNLLSGVLDPDKLDYLNRDAYYCGVPYGIQDTDFILSRIEPDRERGIILDSRAIMSIESILFSKYLMYRTVYWHKQVRIATAMMKKSVFAALEKKLIHPCDLYALDDSLIYTLLDSLDYPEKELSSSVRSRSFYQVLAEYPFNPETMTTLEDLYHRADAEINIAEYLSGLTGTHIHSAEILIDIPERISFESDLFISDEHTAFSSSSTVFSKGLVQRFTSSLRILRIAIHQKHVSRVSEISDMNGKLAQCLKVGYTFKNR